jgi:phosphate transport system permease protein
MDDVARLIAYRKRQDRVFQIFGIVCTLVGVITLVALLVKLGIDGYPVLKRLSFYTSNASFMPEQAGILMALAGSISVILVTFLTAVPIGVAAAVYLEEYGRKTWLASAIEVNISNLAGVPSITYGLVALWIFGVFVPLVLKTTAAWFGVKPAPFSASSIFVGGATLGLLVLPIIIVTTREALRSIPNAIREAAYASGATKWQTIRYHLLPYSLGGIATGTIIAMSRALGESAPLIVVGAAGWLSDLPASPLNPRYPLVGWLNSDFTVLPIQMFTWSGDPDPAFQQNAAAAGLVLIVLTLSMNAVAIWLRYRVRRKLKW